MKRIGLGLTIDPNLRTFIRENRKRSSLSLKTTRKIKTTGKIKHPSLCSHEHCVWWRLKDAFNRNKEFLNRIKFLHDKGEKNEEEDD